MAIDLDGVLIGGRSQATDGDFIRAGLDNGQLLEFVIT